MSMGGWDINGKYYTELDDETEGQRSERASRDLEEYRIRKHLGL